MKTILRAAAVCIGLFMLLIISAGCEADFWPLSLLQDEKEKQYEGKTITLPVIKDEDEKKKNDDENTATYLFYYPDNKNQFLVPVTRRIPRTEGIAKAVLGELISTPELEGKLSAAGLSPSIPSNTTVRDVNIHEGLATVNFSASFLTFPEDNEKLVMDSILCSLKQFESIEQVMVVVEGVDFDKFPGGGQGNTPLGPESRINLEISDDLQDYRDYTATKIYFAYHAGNGKFFYVPVTRVTDPRDDAVKASVLELLAGPRRNSGLFSEIPSGTDLLDYSLENGTVTVNLSDRLSGYRGGLTGEENIINQIVLTLTGHPSVEKVKILIEGEERKLPKGTDLAQPFTRPEHYNCL